MISFGCVLRVWANVGFGANMFKLFLFGGPSISVSTIRESLARWDPLSLGGSALFELNSSNPLGGASTEPNGSDREAARQGQVEVGLIRSE